ncbi:MAG: AIR synthase-related protein, partial [Bryobacteraceae bacterium]
ESAHDLSDGGLAVAAAECTFGPASMGANLELDSALRPEFLLFHEGPSRILISTDRPEEIQRIAREHSVEAPVVGMTAPGRLTIKNRGQSLIDYQTEELRGFWAGALERALHA